MKNKLAALLCLALLVALAPAGAYPTAAAPLPSEQRAGVRGESLNLSMLFGEVRGYSPSVGSDYLSIPTAAFLPMSQDYSYTNVGRIIKAEGSQAKFRAPVYLPNGSYIDSVTACFYDDSSTTSGTVKLYNADLADATSITEMATMGSVTASDYHLFTDSTVSPVANNNLAFTYWLELTLPASGGPGSDVFGCGVFIEYVRSQTAYNAISIPGAAFDRPFEDGYNAGHTQTGGRLVHFHRPADSDPGVYLAQVTLPDQALVTRATLYFQDDNAGQAIDFYLVRAVDGASYEMATASSTDVFYKTEDTTISYPTIDNSDCSYYAYVVLPVTNLSLWAVTIEYTLPVRDYDLMSISNAAFTGSYNDFGYENHGRWLFHLDSGSHPGYGSYSAPVFLPHKARIDKVGCTFYDGNTLQEGACYLSRARLGTSTVMGQAGSSGSAGYDTDDDSSITNASVDNSQYTYYVLVVLPVSLATLPPASTGVLGVKVKIYYTSFYPVFLPVVRK